MAKKKGTVIVVSEQEVDEVEAVLAQAEDEVGESRQVAGLNWEEETIVITTDELVEDDMRALFEPPLMREFIDFVSAGMPDVFLRSHPNLVDEGNLKEIEAALERVPDRSLKTHLTSRLAAVESFRQERG